MSRLCSILLVCLPRLPMISMTSLFFFFRSLLPPHTATRNYFVKTGTDNGRNVKVIDLGGPTSIRWECNELKENETSSAFVKSRGRAVYKKKCNNDNTNNIKNSTSCWFLGGVDDVTLIHGKPKFFFFFFLLLLLFDCASGHSYHFPRVFLVFFLLKFFFALLFNMLLLFVL